MNCEKVFNENNKIVNTCEARIGRDVEGDVSFYDDFF
jgi:hypothetical protein